MERKNYFSKKILRWFRKNKRNFFWRRRPNAYTVFITEVFLKKTSAPYAEPFLRAFLRKFPSPKILSKSKTAELKKFFRELGLTGRAEGLKKAATQMCERHGCRVPREKNDLKEIHLIGDYTCNAILSFAYGEREPIVDTNVIRIYRRYFGLRPNPRAHTDKKMWSFAQKVLPAKRADARDFNWALLDFGALVCMARNPKCATCLVKSTCDYKRGKARR